MASRRSRRALQYQFPMGEEVPGFEVDRGVLLTGLERYFPSGCNQLSDVRGARRAFSSFGFSTSEITAEARGEVLAMLYEGRPFHPAVPWRVFVDTGAFSEQEFPKDGGPPVLVRPVSGEEMARRMRMAESFAWVGGKRVHVVAPDRVGDQLYTLGLLRDFRELLRRIACVHGARIIVPVQKGSAMSMAEMAESALQALNPGLPGMSGPGVLAYTPIWGIPAKKDATSLEDLAVFARRLPRGSAVHFLGMGPHSTRYEKAKELVCSLVEEAEVWSDSVRVRALVGQGRPITLATRAAEVEGHEDPRAVAVARVLDADERERVAYGVAAGWRPEGREA